MSLGCAGLLHFVLLRYTFAPSHRPPTRPSLPIEVLPFPSPSSHTAGPAPGEGPRRASRSKKRIDSLSLGDLGIAWKGKGVPQDGKAAFEHRDAFYRKGTLLEGMRETGLLENLKQRIEQALYYPREFREAGIRGQVRVWIRCRPNGVCPLARSSFETPERLLRVLVWRILEGVFEAPLPASFRRHLPLALEMVFIFDIDTGESFRHLGIAPDPSARTARSFSGRRMVFRRLGGDSLLARVGAKEVLGSRIPTLSFDVERAYERTKDWVEGRERPDPLDKWKLDPRY